jgi:hypothetical protein
MNLKSFPSLDRGASSTRAHPHSMGQHQLNRSIVASVLSLAAVATVYQPEKAGAVDLSFATIDTTRSTSSNPNTFGFNFGSGVSANTIYYTNVASGVDARITASVFNGTGSYLFNQSIYNYSANTTGQPTGDAAFLYYNNATTTTGLGTGGMRYTIDLFQTNGTTHTYSTAYVAPDLRFSVYDVDGEAPQSEAVRVAKGDIATNSGLAGYQVGTSAASLIASEDATSYLFSGRNLNQPETDSSSAVLLYFQNTSSVTFQFESNTTSGTVANPIFSGIDGDVSTIGSTNFDTSGHATSTTGFGTYQTATKIPEPFTIIGSLVGGAVAFGMRKKLKATSK